MHCHVFLQERTHYDRLWPGNNISWATEDKPEMADIIETVDCSARKGWDLWCHSYWNAKVVSCHLILCTTMPALCSFYYYYSLLNSIPLKWSSIIYLAVPLLMDI